jgi:hypothetical protein
MDPIEPDIIELQMSLKERGQIFYDLKNKKATSYNSIYSWDLAFDCRKKEFNIIVNYAKGMGAYNTGEKSFSFKYPSKDYPWTYDDPCGDLNLTCIGRWGDFNFDNPQSFENVYILHLGFDEGGNAIGLKKFKIHGFTDQHYLIEYADLDNSNAQTFFIPKNPGYNFTYFTMTENGSLVNVEPPKTDWDIMITPYIDSAKYSSPFSTKISPDLALVEGILHNRHLREVAVDTIASFEAISYFDIDRLEFKRNINNIGSRWRWWDKNRETFFMSKENKYVIRDDNEEYYALEFIKFQKITTTTSTLQFKVKNL